MSNRRKIRETVLKAFYAAQIGDNPPEQVLNMIIKPEIVDDAAGLAFAEQLFLRALDCREQTDEIIRRHIANWEIDRLAQLDRVILQLAITELMTFQDIPAKVTINEAIEIAKKYSTAKSGRFVNGILDAALLSLDEEKRMVKQGRGLIDQPARHYKSKHGRDKNTASDIKSNASPGFVPEPSPDTGSGLQSHDSPESTETHGDEVKSDQPKQKKKRIKRR